MSGDAKEKAVGELTPEGKESGVPEGGSAPVEVSSEPIVIVPPNEVKMTRVEKHPVIETMMAQYVLDWKREHGSDKKPRPYFYVSDAGRCARQIAYQFLRPEEKHDMNASTIIMFKMGDLFHRETQDMLLRIGATTAKDIEFGTFGEFDFDPRGRLDVFLNDDDETLVVTDIKSKNSYAFAGAPSIEEVLQTMLYVYQCKRDKYFAKRGKKIADYSYLLYVDRGGMADEQFAMWRIEYDEALVEVARAWFQKVADEIKAKHYPERPYTRDSIQCSYCRFSSACWADIPAPELPALVKDESIVPPTQEIVESMARLFVQTRAQIKELERDVEAAEAVLTQYFKGTGQEELDVDGAKVRYEIRTTNEIDIEYLMKYAKDKWPAFAKPQITMLRDAVDKGIISGTVFEKAMKPKVSGSVKVVKPKKAKP